MASWPHCQIGLPVAHGATARLNNTTMCCPSVPRHDGGMHVVEANCTRDLPDVNEFLARC